MSTISELCQRLIETNKSQHYHLIDILIHLILILLIFTITTKRAFLTMMIYIEQEIARDIDSDSIINDFFFTKY